MSECCQGSKFACVFLKDVFVQLGVRIVSIIDLLCLCSWSPFWNIPKSEPLFGVADLVCYMRFICVNIARSFSQSTSIWPDLLVGISQILSAVLLTDVLMDSLLTYISLFVIVLEFVLIVFSSERRRQRNLWSHNASFRISSLRRNPFQRSIRRSLLLPLLNPARRRGSKPEIVSPDPNLVHVDDEILSNFVDIIPEVQGHNPEKRILHVHCLFAVKPQVSATTVVFIHQFGSGAFTWQSVMADLVNKTTNLVAFDRVAHGLTFASDPIVDGPKHEFIDITPSDDDMRVTVNFSDIVASQSFDVDMIDTVLRELQAGSEHLILVACGGAGARIATEYASRHQVKGIILVSPYLIETDGVPSVLKSVASAQVGRALLVSMAKSEVTDVILRRSWESRDIPPSLVDAYKKAVEVPGWEDAMSNLLRRPASPVSWSSLIPSIACPVLVIGGEKDHFVASLNEYASLATRFQKGRFVTVPNTGASPQEEKPHETSSLISSFINSIS